MENEDSKMESETVVENSSPVTEIEASKETNVELTEAESASSEKSTQNGALEPNKIPENDDNQTKESALEPVEVTEPKITENGAHTKELQVGTQKNSEKPEEEKLEQEQEIASNNTIEENPTRVTRGTKRKANDEINEITREEASNKKIQQKENQNESSHLTKEDLTSNSYSNSNVMGKGRRARVPNKRYSEIMLTPPNKKSSVAAAKVPMEEPIDDPMEAPMIALEKSLSVKDDLLGDFAGFDSAITAASSTKSKVTHDFQDPKYLKPFKYGWKRELVWRSTNVRDQLRMGDIYYYNPAGQKLRSFREISQHLNNEKLTLDNFLFFKVPLGVNDPDKEIVRHAGEGRKSTSSKATPRKTDSLVVGVTPTNSRSKRSSAVGVINAAREKEKEVAIPSSPRNKKKAPAKRGRSAKKTDLLTKPEPMEVDLAPTKSRTSKPCQPCSISCEGLQGIVPMLQCHMCLCLYHYQCEGQNTDEIPNYVCKNCQDQELTPNSAIASPPSLTPDVNSPSSSPTAKVKRTQPPEFRVPLPPIVQRPKKVNSKEPSISEVPIVTQKPLESSSSLVGGLTSYHPHNVQIVNNAEPTIMSRPQIIEYINGRRFMIIPKYNYMSVSSNTSHSDDASTSSGPMISLAPRQEVSEVEGPSSSKGGEEEIEDDVQAVPEDRDDNMTNETSLRQGKDTLDQSKTQSRNQKPKRVSSSSEGRSLLMANYLQNLAFGYTNLLSIFQYLKVQDLLRAGRACKMWRDISRNPILWETIRMKNSKVYSFEGLSNALKRYNTVNLDLRKMLLPNKGNDIWPEFSNSIGEVQTLKKIEFCRCPAAVMEKLPISNPNLEIINSVMIKSDIMNFDSFANLNYIKELRIKAVTSMTLNSILSLKELKNLKILALTSVLHLNRLELSVLAELTNLESLDLGECTEFPATFGQDVLIKLEKLEKLRLEKGQDSCHTFELLDTVKDMKNLQQLELINFDIKAGFDKAIESCTQLKKLMIIPTYVSQSATTNNMVMASALRLRASLTHFVWGVTLELIRVTELFVDQCDDKKNKKVTGTLDCIPVLKPVPDISKDQTIQPASNPPQVEILPLTNLQKLLLNSLPTTRVKILKIPFHATWRQTLQDSAYL
ncbi:unnamed protein product [Ceutorhynchus assimilis]|uniref:MBD domain-containing protein n=1 Tax=Ceutorhynchus assimilis TaxID=467358 RepID=A0A9N9MER2_9CUCU|nr:unnamed protein product [Ceutorhynchus assimilis]